MGLGKHCQGKWAPPPICALVLGLILYDSFIRSPIGSAVISILICFIFFGPIYLYLSMKKKNIWRMVKLALVVITVLGVGGTFYWFYSTLPQVQTEFWGLSLDSTKSDVRFMKGQPKEIQEETETTIELWEFHNGFGNTPDRNDMFVSFDRDGNIGEIYYWPTSGERQSVMDRYSIQGIRANISTLEDVLEKFGEPFLVRIGDTETGRTYYFNQHNLLFVLARNRVIALGITSRDRQEVEVKESSESGDMESEP